MRVVCLPCKQGNVLHDHCGAKRRGVHHSTPSGHSPPQTSLAFAYVIVQFSNNAAQAPFHALLPDIVPEEQRGLTSGVMGLLAVSGNISGVILAGLFIDATKPFAAYQQGLWLAYGIIIAVLVALMLITIASIRESATASARIALQ